MEEIIFHKQTPLRKKYSHIPLIDENGIESYTDENMNNVLRDLKKWCQECRNYWIS